MLIIFTAKRQRHKGKGGDPGQHGTCVSAGGAVREFGGSENDPVNRFPDKRADRLQVETP
jgi:hypothetical protein